MLASDIMNETQREAHSRGCIVGPDQNCIADHLDLLGPVLGDQLAGRRIELVRKICRVAVAHRSCERGIPRQIGEEERVDLCLVRHGRSLSGGSCSAGAAGPDAGYTEAGLRADTRSTIPSLERSTRSISKPSVWR